MTLVNLWWADLRTADIQAAATLPRGERERLDEITDQAGRGRRLVGELLLQAALRSARGLPPSATVDVDRTCADCGAQHGRPVAADGAGPHLSVSHSGLLVAVASCQDAAVGVDVQRDEASGSVWAAREARLKAGVADGEGTVVELEPPLPGYVAALAIAAPTAPVVRLHRS